MVESPDTLPSTESHTVVTELVPDRSCHLRVGNCLRLYCSLTVPRPPLHLRAGTVSPHQEHPSSPQCYLMTLHDLQGLPLPLVPKAPEGRQLLIYARTALYRSREIRGGVFPHSGQGRAARTAWCLAWDRAELWKPRLSSDLLKLTCAQREAGRLPGCSPGPLLEMGLRTSWVGGWVEGRV